MKKYFFVTLLFVISLLFVFSCKEDQPTEPDKSDPKTDYQIIDGDKGTIGAAGGKITVPSNNGDLSGAFVEIPEGALLQNKEIKIILADASEANPEDSSAIMVKCEPAGLEFNSPIKIGLPAKNLNQNSKVGVFYYDKSRNFVEQIAVTSIDQINNIAVAEIEHFSSYYSTVTASGVTSFSMATMGMQMLNVEGHIGVRIFDLGRNNNSGLQNIYSPTSSNALTSLTQGSSKYAHFLITLHKDVVGFDPELERIYVRLVKNSVSGNKWQIKLEDDIGNIFYEGEINRSDQDINNWFSGIPFLFKFSEKPSSGSSTKYYVKIEWFLSPYDDSFIRLVGTGTQIYLFTNKDNSSTLNQMLTYSNDSNNNYIDDNYEESGSSNQPPSVPSQPLPENNKTDVPVDTKLDWYCSDPENDPLTYDIYLSQNNPPSLFESNYTSTNAFDPGGLEAGKSYYWKIVAKDNHQNETPGSIWKFVTRAQGDNPYVPIYTSPADGSVISPTVVDFIWGVNNPTGSNLYYKIYLGLSETELTLIQDLHRSTSYTIGNLNPGKVYFWKIITIKDYSTAYEGSIWSFTTSN